MWALKNEWGESFSFFLRPTKCNTTGGTCIALAAQGVDSRRRQYKKKKEVERRNGSKSKPLRFFSLRHPILIWRFFCVFFLLQLHFISHIPRCHRPHPPPFSSWRCDWNKKNWFRIPNSWNEKTPPKNRYCTRKEKRQPFNQLAIFSLKKM